MIFNQCLFLVTYLNISFEILTSYHPNPSTGEAHYFCGLACRFQGKMEEAYKLFYKATWNYEWRSSGYYQLATIDCFNGNADDALANIESSLDTNRQNNKAVVLKAALLRKEGKDELAKDVLMELLKKDPLDQWAKFELGLLEDQFEEFLTSSRNDAQTVIDLSGDYLEAGFYEEAIKLIELHHSSDMPACAVPNPMQRSAMTWFTLAWLNHKLGNEKASKDMLAKAEAYPTDYFFPSRTIEQLILEWAMENGVNKTVAAYGLGNYYYDLKLYEKAIVSWEEATLQDSKNGTLFRNLGIAYWNFQGNSEKALTAYGKAIELSPKDMRIRYELDQLRKKVNHSPQDRLASLEKLGEQIFERDDFTLAYAALLNYANRYEEALNMLKKHRFHPWEGGEGQVLKQFTYACLRLGQQALKHGKPQKAMEYFNQSLETPDNLGEKYHPLQAIAHINYWKGLAHQALGNLDKANACFSASANEKGDFIAMAVSEYSEMTYYSALSLAELGKKEEAEKLFSELKKFALAKMEEQPKIEYFATSLPQILVFDEDLEKANRCDAAFLVGLAELGLGNNENARQHFEEVLQLNITHAHAKDLVQEL